MTVNQELSPSPASMVRVLSVSERVLTTWFPVNPEVHNEIQRKLAAGEYENNRELLVSDLKRDFSLFMYCFREIVAGLGDEESCLPHEIFDHTKYSVLKEILTRSSQDVSFFSFESATSSQRAHLTDTLVGASVTESLAPFKELEPDTAFACALLRQLGLTLISWNFPHVYSKATAQSKDPQIIDRLLSQQLGFTPALLGIVIGRKLKLGPSILHALGDRELEGITENETQKGEALTRLCELGELFARTYSDAEEPSQGSWDDTLGAITSLFGEEALAPVFANIQKTVGHLLTKSTRIFEWEPKESAVPRPSRSTPTEYLGNNVYLKSCPHSLRDTLSKVYADLTPGKPNRELIFKVAKKIIPDTGFTRGCVYLLEPDSRLLVPRLAIGERPLELYQAVEYSNNSEDPVAKALRSQAPVIDLKIERFPYIAGLLGEFERVGVLYLEVSKQLIENKTSNPLLYFKAIRLTLEDCMGVK